MFGAKTLTSNRPSAPLVSHPAFTPIMVGWTSLLFASVVFICAMAISSSTLLQLLLALLAAVGGAICGYFTAKSLGAKVPRVGVLRTQRAADEEYAENVTGRRGASIINTQDLGSASLDAPLDLEMSDVLEENGLESASEAEEFSSEALEADAFEDEDISVELDEPIAFAAEETSEDEERATYYEDPFAEDGFDGQASPNDRHAHDALGRPRYDFTKPMDLGRSDGEPTSHHAVDAVPTQEFAPAAVTAPIILEAPKITQSNGFEDGGSTDEVAEIAETNDTLALGATEADAPLHQAQVIDLKDRDLKDLSLVQMVDRFAVGLQDHRRARVNDPSSRAIRPSDPRIAQAIRDLPISDLRPSAGNNATRAQAEQTEAALREALEKLQQMSDHG